ncbi:hypothetical protein ACTFIY_003768 [Dictyostelium cf. discoideum]
MNVTDIYSVSGYKGSSYTNFTVTFGTSNTSIVSLTINNVPCTVYSISPTSIAFSNNYNLVLGDSILLLNIGGLVYSTSINVVMVLAPKLFKTYDWISNDNIIFKGSTFSSYANSINGIDQIYFDVDLLISSLTIGQSFTVKVHSCIGYSNLVSFLYIKSISVNTIGIYNIDGLGSLSTIFYGSYGTSVSLYIGDLECTINSIDPTLINFSHTSNLKLGSNDLHINIGGFEYTTSVYVMSAPTLILLNSYYWSEDDNIVLKGSTFNYKSPNKVNINSVDFNSPPAFSNNSMDTIKFNDNSITSSLTIVQYDTTPTPTPSPSQTSDSQTTGTQTTETQTTETQTTGTQTTGTQTTGTQTTGTQTTGTQTTGTQTTGTRTSSKPDEPSDEEHLSISFKLPISFILTIFI